MSAQVRVRFAPSPTGFLHVGGVRTALFNWLYARHHGGQFFLRIEDTDRQRSRAEFTEDILETLRWLHLDYEQEPWYQSQRLSRYRHQVEELIDRGHAYRCVCSESDVDQMRVEASEEGKRPQYDRRCRNLNLPDRGTYVVRAKIPLEGEVVFPDLIRGCICVENSQVDDFVLLRSDGFPTYNLSAVVDDAESRITHVLRGDDHINNTPKQLHLYHFLGFQPPQFGHLPMILGADKKKLSKRHGVVSASLYRKEGYLPEALLNFLVRIGWSHGDQEIFSLAQMVEFFSLESIQKSSGVFNPKKLLAINGSHLRALSPEVLRDCLFQEGFVSEYEEYLRTSIGKHLLVWLQPKAKLLKDFSEHLAFLKQKEGRRDMESLECFQKPLVWKSVVVSLNSWVKSCSLRVAASTQERLGWDAIWGQVPSLGDLGVTHEEVYEDFRGLAFSGGIEIKDLVQPLRFLLTSQMQGPSIFELVTFLPWDWIERRCSILK